MMEVERASDALLCWFFSTTLHDGALIWFQGLEPDSISSFLELLEKFMTYYRYNIPTYVSYDLFTIRQGSTKTLRSYHTRFKELHRKIEKPDERIVMSVFERGLQPGLLLESFVRNKSVDLVDVMHRAEMEERVVEISAIAMTPAVVVQERSLGKKKRSKCSAEKQGRPWDISRR